MSLITSRFAPLPQLTSICSMACLDLSRSFHGHFHKYERTWRSLPSLSIQPRASPTIPLPRLVPLASLSY